MGKQEWKGNLNLMNIVMVGIAKKIPEYREGYALHRLLGGILSGELTLEEKKAIIREAGIKDEDGLREDVVSMCNLSEGVLERGIDIGKKRGIEIGEKRGEKRGKRKGIAIGKKRGINIGEQREKVRYISNMYQIGFSIEDIAKVSQMSREDVMKIIEKM